MKKSSLLFESLVTPVRIDVFKSTVMNEYTMKCGDETLGVFRNLGDEWSFYDGTLLWRFRMLSDLFDFVRGRV